MSKDETVQILDAAQQLLREQGPGFTMDQLEERVGVSRATLYRRVGSRAELLDRLATERNEAIDDTRRQILKAARTVVGREGPSGATIEQIAAEAGVGVATVYRQFETKDGLLRAFIEEMTPRPIIRSLSASDGADISIELEAVITALVAFVHELRDILRIALLGDERERRYMKSLREGSESSFDWLTAYFERRQRAGLITTNVEPSGLALSLMGMVLSFGMIGPLHYGSLLTAPESAAKTITDVFLNGVATS